MLLLVFTLFIELSHSSTTLTHISKWPAVVEIWNASNNNKKNLNVRTPWRSLLNRENRHFWSASLVSLVTNLQASGSLGSSLLWVALTPWPVKKPTQRLILWATKGQMKPQLDRSWRGRIPTSFSGSRDKCLRKEKLTSLNIKTKYVLFIRLWNSRINFFYISHLESSNVQDIVHYLISWRNFLQFKLTRQ